MRAARRDPTAAAGRLDDRTILVTGATSGLGRHLALRLASAGARVLLHGRDPDRVHQTAETIRSTGGRAVELVADLAELRQVDALADRLLAGHDRLDAVVSNAGIGAGPPGAAREESADGIELRFAVNHLAGYHLVRRLLPLLTTSAPARIVNVASLGQHPIPADDPLMERPGAYDGFTAYARSKLAQVMFTFDLAAELHGHAVTANAVHPATFMDTAMVREAGVEPMSTVPEGANAVLRLVVSPTMREVTGRFFDGEHEAAAAGQAYDTDARRRVRELSDRLIEQALAE
ncbi:SDR family NAD(P)-dependent oxidoreductase [Allostreptomyces psammosilenae]|uniref:NAD(P)-dependent dehydrogenase (Short-subunit alcohol dehydrogenase family) n=1 Tax=Allostreptomyces psammosilenae TaxID=1892865 RepID=A0A852ZN66_9ACTN|nr:SDR family NAD(P)-dependent oxidoreductase [Allostreptomyces psammosilenae]NYI03105.1 NAD(P)-dependent dehydrogenase (short-subunit alcohol dehydrogenase family) [Allostreptomyces psammosilenae]